MQQIKNPTKIKHFRALRSLKQLQSSQEEQQQQKSQIVLNLRMLAVAVKRMHTAKKTWT